MALYLYLRLGMRPFSWRTIQEHRELYVILALGTCVGLMITGSLIWAALKKDYNFIRSNPRRDESYDLLHPAPLKLLILNPRSLDPRPTLHETYRLMAVEERKRRRDDEANCQAQS